MNYLINSVDFMNIYLTLSSDNRIDLPNTHEISTKKKKRPYLRTKENLNKFYRVEE